MIEEKQWALYGQPDVFNRTYRLMRLVSIDKNIAADGSVQHTMSFYIASLTKELSALAIHPLLTITYEAKVQTF